MVWLWCISLVLYSLKSYNLGFVLWYVLRLVNCLSFYVMFFYIYENVLFEVMVVSLYSYFLDFG